MHKLSLMSAIIGIWMCFSGASANAEFRMVLRSGPDNPFHAVNPEQGTALDEADNRLVALDVDGDSDLDVLVGRNTSPPFLLRNVGSGSPVFQKDTVSLFGALDFSASNMAVGDINGDGTSDLLCNILNVPYLFLGTGSSSFISAPAETDPLRDLPMPGSAQLYGSLFLFDSDGDGDLDLFGRGGIFNELNTVVLDIRNSDDSGNGTAPYFELGTSFASELDPPDSAIGLGDVDNDGDIDFIVTTEDPTNTWPMRLVFLENDGDGAFSSLDGQSHPFDNFVVADTAFPIELSLIDFDLDGDLDAVWEEKFTGGSEFYSGNLVLWENVDTSSNRDNPTYTKRAGSANPFDEVPDGAHQEILACDLDDDGDEDYVVMIVQFLDSTYKFKILYFENRAEFSEFETLTHAWHDPSAVGSEDGSQLNPFSRFLDATDSLVDDGTGHLHLASGSYPSRTLTKAMRIVSSGGSVLLGDSN